MATVTYHYGEQAAARSPHWPRDPHAYDMCARHAERLRPPKGWMLDDRRMRSSGPVALAVERSATVADETATAPESADAS